MKTFSRVGIRPDDESPRARGDSKKKYLKHANYILNLNDFDFWCALNCTRCGTPFDRRGSRSSVLLLDEASPKAKDQQQRKHNDSNDDSL